jgi:hypothetical protein
MLGLGMIDCGSGRSGCANGWRSIRARAACCGRAEVEAAYRFFSNEKVTAARVLAPHHNASLRRLAAHPVVLGHDGAGFHGQADHRPGALELRRDVYLHVTTALTPRRQALGIVAHEFFVHDPACFGQARKRAIGYYARSIEEKESGRWLSRACARSGAGDAADLSV